MKEVGIITSVHQTQLGKDERGEERREDGKEGERKMGNETYRTGQRGWRE